MHRQAPGANCLVTGKVVGGKLAALASLSRHSGPRREPRNTLPSQIRASRNPKIAASAIAMRRALC